MIFHSHANKTHFHKKGWAPSLVLIQRPGGTRKWPIILPLSSQVIARMYKVGPSLLIPKRPHGQAIVHNCSWTHCWARPFLRARSEHRYQLVDIHPPRCYHQSVLRCQNHIFCCWSDLRMRAKRIPLPGNPTGAHQDLSITSKEKVLSNGQYFLTPVERPMDTLWSLHNVVFLIVLN